MTPQCPTLALVERRRTSWTSSLRQGCESLAGGAEEELILSSSAIQIQKIEAERERERVFAQAADAAQA